MASEKSSMATKIKTKKVITLMPPDGGWGWMVLLGTALSNIFNQSMLSLFSLLYGDALEAMGYEIKGAAIVMSTMLFVSNFSGPIAGAIVKVTSSRFVAVTGAGFCTFGILFSGFSTNIFHLMLTYGVFLGLGLGFIQNSSFVAINSYFTTRKSRAVGLANVGTGVGQTLMPHLVRYLLENYGFRGACLLLSSLSLHGIAGTLLIQPVAWHMKKVEEEVVVDENLSLLSNNKHKNIVIRQNSIANGLNNKKRRATDPELTNVEKQNGSNGKISQSHAELRVNDKKKDKTGVNGLNGKRVTHPEKKTWYNKIYELFDLTLLSSPRFVNIIVGTALAVTSIQNFSMLYPFFLQKTAQLTKHETAMCMSAVAIADIVGRLTLPIFQDKYRIRARWMLIMTSIWLIIVRQIMAYQSNFQVLIVMSCLYGCGRSMIIVARNIAISENCRLDQVPAAVGLGMLSMGVFVPPVGYLLGWIRDYTVSYIICITAQNMLLVIFLVMWIPDMLYLMMQERKRQSTKAEQTELS